MYPTDPTDPTRSADRRPAGELPAGPAHAAHPAGGDGTGPADPARAERADERPAETTGADRLSPWLTQPAPARTVELISGDFLITVNPVDGSEIEPCPPGSQPPAPVRLGADERAELRRAGRPPIPPGPGAPPLPLLERRDERDRLVALLGRGRSVRLTGSAGSGRTALLEAVAADCETLAPDGVVRLSGHHRTVTELLYELYAAVFRSPLHRPDRAGLRDLVRGIGAVVVVDDLEFGGDTLDELLEAAPECAFLLAVTPDVDAPISRSPLEEVLLGGLGRAASLDLLERATGRPLTDEEANWAGDLWFESEGLPQRFVQVGALLRGRDRLRAGPDAYEADGVLVHELAEPAYDRGPGDGPAGFAADGYDVPAPLPTLGEGAAPAGLLASRLGDAARETLRFAVALGGEVPHQAHLPALVGDTHADAAVGELMSSGLLSPVGARYRLAAGAVAQLEAEGYGEGATARAHTAVQHFTWWAGHPSVTPRRASTEADALLAALTPLLSSGEAATRAPPSCWPGPRRPPSWRACTGAPGSARCAPARRRPGSPGRSPKRRTSTTSWAFSRSASAAWTGPAPNWRPPSACAGPWPTGGARSPAAGHSRWSPTGSRATPRPSSSRPTTNPRRRPRAGRRWSSPSCGSRPRTSG